MLRVSEVGGQHTARVPGLKALLRMFIDIPSDLEALKVKTHLRRHISCAFSNGSIFQLVRNKSVLTSSICLLIVVARGLQH